jgi:hypothetical protein
MWLDWVLGCCFRGEKVKWTYGLEGLDGLLFEVVLVEVELGVVDGQPARGALRAPEEGLDGEDGDAVVGAVGGVFEVEHGGPVVGEVLGHLAGRAGAPRAHVAHHGGVEGVAAHVHHIVGGRDRAGLDDRVQSLEGQGRAGEAEACLDLRGGERQSCYYGKGLHDWALALGKGGLSWQVGFVEYQGMGEA